MGGDSLLQTGLTKNNEKSSTGEVLCNRENGNAVLLNNLIWSISIKLQLTLPG